MFFVKQKTKKRRERAHFAKKASTTSEFCQQTESIADAKATILAKSVGCFCCCGCCRISGALLHHSQNEIKTKMKRKISSGNNNASEQHTNP